MSAQPLYEDGPDDPVEILHVLPARFHEQFLAEYEVAVDGARRPEQYRQLHDLLRLWRLRAVAYAEAGYETRLQDVRDAVRTGAWKAPHRSRRLFPAGPSAGDIPG